MAGKQKYAWLAIEHIPILCDFHPALRHICMLPGGPSIPLYMS